MLLVISPAKTLDFETPCDAEVSYPRFREETLELIGVLKEKSPEEIRKLMNLSENLAELNLSRYRQFEATKHPKVAKQSIYAFKGDVYVGLKPETLNKEDMFYAQEHLRILSGLYGLLRPLDIIQPYRLEMGTRLAFGNYNTLYHYWADKIANLMNGELEKQGDNILLNLASQEYFKALNRKTLKARVVDVEFLDQKNGEYKIISFFAKKARGMMARYIIQNRISEPEELQGFDDEGYYCDVQNTTPDKLIFKRG